jgi:uncharacterized Zn finger protein (UPF0148 family)
MKQSNNCPNCGTPVSYGANYCGICGINFTWITPEEASLLQEMINDLSRSRRAGKTLQPQVNRREMEAQGRKRGSAAVAEIEEPQGEHLAVQFREGIFRLLDSVLGNRATCSGA